MSSASTTSRLIKGLSGTKPANMEGDGLLGMLWHPLTPLLVCLPVGVAALVYDWGAIYVFWLLFFAMIPLAKILGDATEELAAGLRNEMLAGLLNATFGNAVEMVITVQTLRAGLFDVVKATLLGSVLSNLLLVLGMSFFCGGMVQNRKKRQTAPHLAMRQTLSANSQARAELDLGPEQVVTEFAGEKIQSFQVLSALVNTSMLLLSCLSFSLATVFYSITHKTQPAGMEEVILPVSRICSFIIMIAYVAYIFFQLVTHREALADGDDGGDEEEPKISIRMAVILLFVITLITAVTSEMLVGTIEEVTEKAHISQHFIGIILLPIVGNACEHAAAVRFAIQDKPGLSVGIAIGSSTQISLFVVPFAVLAGWACDKPMDLNFGALNTTVMIMSVIIVMSVVVNGQATWVQGYTMCSAYVVVAVLYWNVPNNVPTDM